MKRRPRSQRLVSEINITPFTDVILVLLVIFIIATPLLSQADLKIKPVKTQKNKSSAENIRKTTITINQNGIVFWEKNAVTFDELSDEIDSLRDKNSDPAVILHIDPQAKFEHISKVLDILNTLNIKNISVTIENTR